MSHYVHVIGLSEAKFTVHGQRKRSITIHRENKGFNSRFTKILKYPYTNHSENKGSKFTVHEENKTQFTVHRKNKSPITVHGNTSLRPSCLGHRIFLLHSGH